MQLGRIFSFNSAITEPAALIILLLMLSYATSTMNYFSSATTTMTYMSTATSIMTSFSSATSA